mmetsp:Transcript_24729/g.44725  ORF Transcript_24729/g.44725 Transcript_24729/m.44725 type:complete len:586 (-) Transcript_24729:1742-3499(-)
MQPEHTENKSMDASTSTLASTGWARFPDDESGAVSETNEKGAEPELMIHAKKPSNRELDAMMKPMKRAPTKTSKVGKARRESDGSSSEARRETGTSSANINHKGKKKKKKSKLPKSERVATNTLESSSSHQIQEEDLNLGNNASLDFQVTLDGNVKKSLPAGAATSVPEDREKPLRRRRQRHEEDDLSSRKPPSGRMSTIDDVNTVPIVSLASVGRRDETNGDPKGSYKVDDDSLVTSHSFGLLGNNNTSTFLASAEHLDGDVTALEVEEGRGSGVLSSMRRESRRESQPGAFYMDGRNARDVSVNEEWSASVDREQNTITHSSLHQMEIIADVVDPEEMNRELQQRLDEELAERERNAALAEVVTGCWCSPRFMKLIAIGASLIILAVVLGTALPQVLKPPEMQPSPLPGLIDLLSSVSPDGGAALKSDSTPQYDALNWLASNAKLDSYANNKKIQRYALATVYYGTNGNAWRVQFDWLNKDEDECGCNGTTHSCSGDDVVMLSLWRNKLLGTIPVEVSLLSSLQELILTENQLSGTIPTEIGLLSNLTDLWPEDNSLTGTIASEIGLLTNIGWFLTIVFAFHP